MLKGPIGNLNWELLFLEFKKSLIDDKLPIDDFELGIGDLVSPNPLS